MNFWQFIIFILVPSGATNMLDFLNQNVGMIQAVLTITLVGITAFYAWQTKKTVQEITKQTNLQQMPVVMLLIRDVRDFTDYNEEYEDYQQKYRDFFIYIKGDLNKNKFYYLTLRNTGNGAAFNIDVSSDIFEVKKYKNQFLAPSKDEQPFAICEKDNKTIESWNKFKNSSFDISCKDIMGALHIFRYKIIDIETKNVDFIGLK